MTGLSGELESDSSEDEWVFSSVDKNQNKQKPTTIPSRPRTKPTLSAASLRMARAHLPSSSRLPPLQLPRVVPPQIEQQTKPTASLQYISDDELVQICSDMDDSMLITRLVSVYKSVEIYIRIREIETESSLIESRLKDHLHHCRDPCDFILNSLATLSKYFVENSKNDDLTAKFRRLLANNLCSALNSFLNTPVDQQVAKFNQMKQEEEVDLISFDDHALRTEKDADLIIFDEDVDEDDDYNEGGENVEDDEETDEDAEDDDDEDDDDDDDDDDENVITLAEILGVPSEIIDRCTLTRDHQLKLIGMMDAVSSPVIIYYAMNVFKLPALIGFGCELEDEGLKLCRLLMKHGNYDEAVTTIRNLNLLSRFPINTTADHFFTAGHGMYLPTLYSGHSELQKQLLSFINKQLRFTYAGNLGVVPQKYLQDLFDGSDKTQQLSRLKERKFQKDLVNCGTKIMKELDIQTGEDYYFILLSQRYACLRYILAQRAIQQVEDGDYSIHASSNFNGLIDLICEEDPVMARLAIKELIDTGDTIAPPYFASLYKQQEFYCRYNALPLNQRLLGVVKGEQLSRHRTTFVRKKPASPQPESYYTLSSHVRRIIVDSYTTLMHMKGILSISTVCGLDTEWVPAFAKTDTVKTALMQIASDVDGYVFLVDLKTIFEPKNTELYQITQIILKLLFEDPNIVKIAFDFSGDLDLLHSSLPSSKDWKIKKMLDLKSIKTKDGRSVSGGLAGVVRTFLNVGLNKRQQLSNWEKRPLTEEQVTYGACDACCLLDVYYTLCQMNHPIVENLPRSSKLHKVQTSPSSLNIRNN